MRQRKPYIAPGAEVICLAPREDIASWQFNNKNNWWWNSGSPIIWGVKPEENASMIGGEFYWFSEDETNPELD